MEWKDGIEHELWFWEQWYATHGLHWKEDYNFRLDPNTELQDHLAEHLQDTESQILDVGAGPLTVLGKCFKGARLNISACDALAEDYARFNARFGITPLVVTQRCMAEDLVPKYGKGSFDLVHAQNCIDHSRDPLQAIFSMFCLLSPWGKIVMTHEVNEGENEQYSGFHQWNFYASEGDFMISGHGACVNVTKLFELYATTITTLLEGHIRVVISKRGEFPESMYMALEIL
jgi:SAM-dependent methyltransferase